MTLSFIFVRGDYIMRYHYEKPTIYRSIYGNTYECDHQVYSKCTLYLSGKRGLEIIQQRYDPETETTWWGEIDPWLTDVLYLHELKKKLDNQLERENRTKLAYDCFKFLNTRVDLDLAGWLNCDIFSHE